MIASVIIGSLAFVICGLYGYILRRRYIRNHTAHDFSNEFEDLVKAGVVQGDANGATTEKIEPKEISRARSVYSFSPISFSPIFQFAVN